MAEAQVAGSVSFVTLTYAEEPDDFRSSYKDVQAMLKRFRIFLHRKCGGNSVRFFCTGELGEQKGRRHWHLLLFFKKPYEIPRPKRNTHWDFWHHGWMTVANLSADEVLQKARYTAKYCVKSQGGPDTLMRCSLRPGIGSEWLVQHAIDVAKAGLSPSGGYSFLGVRHSKGANAGEHVKFRLTGAVARRYCAAWWAAYSLKYPQRAYPANRFLRSYHDDYCEPFFEREKRKGFGSLELVTDVSRFRVAEKPGSSAAELLAAEAERPDDDAFLAISVGRRVAMLHVGKWGAATCHWCGIDYHVDRGIGDVLVLDADDEARIDAWLAKEREKRDTDGEEERAREAREAQREARGCGRRYDAEGRRIVRRKTRSQFCEDIEEFWRAGGFDQDAPQ